MNKYILIDDNGKIAEANSLIECHLLMEEADNYGFDVVDILHGYSMESVMHEVVNLFNDPEQYNENATTETNHTDIPF